MKLYSGLDNAPVENYFDWGVQSIRKHPSLGDLSVAVRNQVPYGNPDMFFNIFIQNGIVKTAIRKYPDYFEKKWTEKFIAGNGVACAIAFDGNWILYNGKWRYVTNEFPHIFWIDSEGILFTQLWDDVDTKFELALNTTKVKAIRAWKNVSFPLKDQGLVAAYIKIDGTVWYRNYCYQSTGEYVWETEVQLEEFAGAAVNVNLFITNDYRTGFVVEDASGNVDIFITTRNWAGMAIPAEKIVANPYEIYLDLIELDYVNGQHEDINLRANPYSIDFDLRYAETDNEFIEIYNESVTLIGENEEEYQDWGKVLIFKTKNELYNVNKSDFEIVDVSNRSYNPDTVEEIDDCVYKLNFIDLNNFNNVNLVGTLKFKGLYTTNGVDALYLPFEKVFYPLNLVPTEVPIPEVVEVWNE